MALIKCPDCGKMVSDRAQNCPDCGFPIQEEVQRLNDITNIEGNDASGEYSDLTEKEVARKLCEAISKKQFADINVFQSILKNKFAEGYYTKIVEDSRDFSDDEAEKNQYIVKNIELILDYLDYPLNAMGIRNWFINKEDRKGKGFFQSDAASFDDFSKYYINCNVCEVIDLKDIMSKIIRSSRFTTRCVISSKSRYAVILKKNVNDYNKLVELSKKFIDAYDSDVKVLSSGTLADSINSGDTVKLFEERYERTVIDYVEMEKQMLHAVAQQLTFTSNVKQPITSIGTKTVAGALLAGPAGALVGYAVGKDKNAKFERSRQYNEEIRREQEEGRKTLNNLQYGDKPTKNIMLTRSYLGIMTFAGTLPFYVDSYYRGQEGWKVTIDDIVKAEDDKCNEFALEKIPSRMKDQIEIRGQLARLYFEKGIIFPETAFVKRNINRLLENPNIPEIALEELENSKSTKYEIYSEERCLEEIQIIEDIKNSTSENEDVTKRANEEIVRVKKAIENIKYNEEEKEYQEIVKQGENASEEELEKLIEQLDKLKLIQGADELIEMYKGRIHKLQEEKKEKERIKAEADAKRYKKINLVTGIISLLVLAAIVIWYIVSQYIPNKRYNMAATLVASENYEKAIELYEKIPSYKDVPSLMAECQNAILYGEAVEKIETKEYDDAIAILGSLGEYKESKELLTKAQKYKIYQDAEQCVNEQKYDEAIEKFSSLESFEDAIDRLAEAKEQKYISIQAYVDAKDYEIAREIYNKEFADYPDVSEKILETYYLEANDFYQSTNYEKAYDFYLEAESYKDAKEKSKECADRIEEECTDTEEKIEWMKKGNKVSEARALEYDYVKSNMNNKDILTYKYLCDLRDDNYEDAVEIYENLYKAKLKVIVNSSKDDTTTNCKSFYQFNLISDTKVEFKKPYCHFIVEGGYPGQTFTFTVKTYHQYYYEKEWIFDESRTVDAITNEWQSVSPFYAPSAYYAYKFEVLGDGLKETICVDTPYER